MEEFGDWTLVELATELQSVEVELSKAQAAADKVSELKRRQKVLQGNIRGRVKDFPGAIPTPQSLPPESEGPSLASIDINSLGDHLPAYTRETAPVNEHNATHVFADEDGNPGSMYIAGTPEIEEAVLSHAANFPDEALIKGSLPNGSIEQPE